VSSTIDVPPARHSHRYSVSDLGDQRRTLASTGVRAVISGEPPEERPSGPAPSPGSVEPDG
jgi:hypothetical protein